MERSHAEDQIRRIGGPRHGRGYQAVSVAARSVPAGVAPNPAWVCTGRWKARRIRRRDRFARVDVAPASGALASSTTGTAPRTVGCVAAWAVPPIPAAKVPSNRLTRTTNDPGARQVLLAAARALVVFTTRPRYRVSLGLALSEPVFR